MPPVPSVSSAAAPTGPLQRTPGDGDVCKNDRLASNVRFFRDVLDKAAGASSLNGLLLLILTKRGSCSICN